VTTAKLPSGRTKRIEEPIVLAPGVPEETAILAARAVAEMKRARAAAMLAPPFDEFARWWFVTRYEKGDLGRRPAQSSTASEVRAHVDVMREAWGARAVDTITHDDVRALVQGYPGAASWKNRLLKHVRALFADAQRFGYDDTGWKLLDNPAARMPLYEERVKHKAQLQLGECFAVLEWLLEHHAATVRGHAAMLLCGLRINEVRRMHCDRVLLGDEYAPCAGAFWFDEEHRKNGRAIAVPIPKQALRFFVHVPPFGRWCDVHDDRLRRELRAATAALGIDRDITPHGLRGTWATIAHGLGVPKHYIMTTLGQTTERVTEKHYLRLGDPVARAMMANVGRAFEVAAAPPSEGTVKQ
jgi:integrase